VHVVFFNRAFHPETSATSQLLTELCRGLVHEYGCRVSVVTGVPLSPGGRAEPRRGLVTRECHDGIVVFRARGTRFSKRRALGRMSNYVTYFLSACLAGFRLERPDVVVALTDPPIIGLAGYLAARWFRAYFVMAYKDIFPEVAVLLKDFHSGTVNRALQAVNRFLVGRADRVCALGEVMRRRLIEGKGAAAWKTLVIPDWADCEEIVPGPRRNPFSIAHGLDDKFVVMHSGNLGLSQGLESIVEAATLLREAADLRVVFVGDGVTKAALQEQVGRLGLDNVVFLPYTPQARLRESFATADVFIVSLKRGLGGYIVPSKLYGILAAGRPCVAAVEEDCEVAVISRAWECGLVVEPDRPADLAAAILRLYGDRALAGRLGENARRAGLAFDRRVQLRAYHDLFLFLSRAPERRSPPKRALDVCLAGAGLLLTSPLWLVAAIAVKLGDGGPVFYRQTRVGRGGVRFTSWKFRSMREDSDRTFGPRQADTDDPRITRVGRILRATAMDELPQLWNIVRGDMSFVGPRALMPEEIEVRGDGTAIPIEKIPGYDARHRVVPGLTGVAQIYADRDLPRRQKFRYDILYICRRSFGLDVRLILLSVWITFRGAWERARRGVTHRSSRGPASW
jgi:lipopolysaccharide/colanic/teichoic acid biosynthesis glycosyltransferase/glycosyltransferase involved in cell wall biosynthesis